ncbi:MAG: OmpA family protein, partial [Pseudomonadota bacterium]|nr:OmpA family protein [Pseudomonadota bacterium]
AERLRIQAQIQAEEAARMRQQVEAEAAAMQDVEAALQGVAGAQSARLSAAREREAELARQEAVLVAGGSLPPSTREDRGEVFVLAGDAFASGRATLTGGASSHVRTLAAYLQADPGLRVVVEGHTDSQGQAEANRALSQRRADAVRDALVTAGIPQARVSARGRGADRPVASNDTAAGRAANRRVEIVVAPE